MVLIIPKVILRTSYVIYNNIFTILQACGVISSRCTMALKADQKNYNWKMTTQLNVEREEEKKHLVVIHINKKEYKVKPGSYTVAAIKEIGGVPFADDLEQIVDGKLVPLPDNGSVLIKGGEKFVSHPKEGGAS